MSSSLLRVRGRCVFVFLREAAFVGKSVCSSAHPFLASSSVRRYVCPSAHTSLPNSSVCRFVCRSIHNELSDVFDSSVWAYRTFAPFVRSLVRSFVRSFVRSSIFHPSAYPPRPAVGSFPSLSLCVWKVFCSPVMNGYLDRLGLVWWGEAIIKLYKFMWRDFWWRR